MMRRENLEKGTKVDMEHPGVNYTTRARFATIRSSVDLTGRVKDVGTIDPLPMPAECVRRTLREALGSELKIVVFTQYLGVMDIIGHHLEKEGIGYTDLRGDTVTAPRGSINSRAIRIAGFSSVVCLRVGSGSI